jgi:hypothetical protein
MSVTAVGRRVLEEKEIRGLCRNGGKEAETGFGSFRIAVL